MSIIVIIKYLYETYRVLVIDICYIVNLDPLFKDLIVVKWCINYLSRILRKYINE